MNVINESFGIQEYRSALLEIHPQLVIPLLSQICFVRQLSLPKALEDRQKTDPEALTFRSTSVEIIKGLFSLGKDWATYAHIQFQEGWTLLDMPGKFLQGTRLLARAMVENDSPQIQGVFAEAVSVFHNEEDEIKQMTALALMVEFLKSPSAKQMVDVTMLRQHLEEGASSSSLGIQDLCLKALRNEIFQPGEVQRLQDQLPVFLELLFHGEEQDVLQGLKNIMATLRDLDGHGAGDISLELILNIRSFFEDERPSI